MCILKFNGKKSGKLKLLFCDLTALWQVLMLFKAVQRKDAYKNVWKKEGKVNKETITTKEAVQHFEQAT